MQVGVLLTQTPVDEQNHPEQSITDESAGAYLDVFRSHFQEHANVFADAPLVFVSNEDFAEARNLTRSKEPDFRPGVFIPGKGQEYSSWETSRHQNPHGKDIAIFKLKAPTPIEAVCISTEFHEGNQSPQAQIWACSLHDSEIPKETSKEFWETRHWEQITPILDLEGHVKHYYQPIPEGREYTHFKVDNIPDGGISRVLATKERTAVAQGSLILDAELREIPPLSGYNNVYGEVSVRRADENIDALVIGESCDLVSDKFGGRILATSNERYSKTPQRVICDDYPIDMGDGIETARQRMVNGTMQWQYVIIRPGILGKPTQLSCSYQFFVFNTPVMIQLLGWSKDGGEGHWDTILDTVRVKEYATQQFNCELQADKSYDLYAYGFFPCGGTHRIHIIGEYVGRSNLDIERPEQIDDQILQRVQTKLSRNIGSDIVGISRRNVSPPETRPLISSKSLPLDLDLV